MGRETRDGESADIVNRGHLVVYIQLGHFDMVVALALLPFFSRSVCCRLSDRQDGKNKIAQGLKKVQASWAGRAGNCQHN